MAHTTLTYVEGVVRCEDLEEMLFAAAALTQLRIRLDTIPEEDEEDEEPNPFRMDYGYDYVPEYDDAPFDQDYWNDVAFEDYLDYLDYREQSYD